MRIYWYVATKEPIQIPEPAFSRILFSSTYFSWLWLIARVYVGYQWLIAGWGKINSPVWVGPHAGGALKGFLMSSFQKTAGPHPDVSVWYAWLLTHIALPQVAMLSHVVAFGELLVGVALILGIFTGIAAFFGAFMNMNYLFAGTVSINPIMFLVELFLILAWRIAGWYGLDRYLLPLLGTPWRPGKAFKK